MSKIDKWRNMSAEASQAVLQEVDDTTLLQARIAILNKQEELKLKGTQEVIVLLKDLQNAIKTSVDDVRRAANTVRNYPAETAVQIAARVEETLVRCEKAGEQAQKNFEKTQRIIYDIQQLDISRLCCFCAAGLHGSDHFRHHEYHRPLSFPVAKKGSRPNQAAPFF